MTKARTVPVWIAVIAHRHGSDVYVAGTEKELNDKVYAYVAEWWATELDIEDPSIGKFPADEPDENKVIDSYFGFIAEESNDEYIEHWGCHEFKPAEA